MLRDERQAALDEVIVACKTLADHYEEAAGLAEHSALADLFRELAGGRGRQAGELEAHLRRLGELPREPDADRETVESLLSRARSALAEDRDRELIEEREAAERELLGRIDGALAEDFSAATRRVLEDLRREVEAAIDRLEAASADYSA